MTDEQIREAFEKEGPFTWRRWYGSGYTQFKMLLKEHQGRLESYTIREGKCMDCGERIGIFAIDAYFPREAKTVTLIEKYRDKCC